MEEKRETFNEKPVYSLTEISRSLQSVISKSYPNAYYIKAEIVRLNYYPHSGHCYPELAEKDGTQIKTQMRAIIWSSQFRDINARFTKITGEPLKEGINILCLAKIEYDVKYGLSLHIQDIEPIYTMGDMIRNKMLVIERLKREKTFNANKERKLPLLPKRIAVISVETSKGYGDFMITLANNPYRYQFECELFPSILQGDKAIITIPARLNEIAQQIDRFDCVVIIRGGGGDVGLSCYDDYQLAASVANFPLPVISGIGHSTNVTVTDMVSYQSKITPTDVANFFIERFREFDVSVESSKNFIEQFSNDLLRETKARLLQLEQNRYNIAVKLMALEQHKQRQIENHIRLLAEKKINEGKLGIDYSEKMISYLAGQFYRKYQEKLHNLEAKIELLRPDNILKRGYSITYLNNRAMTESDELKPGDLIVTKLWKGEVKSEVK